MSLSLADFRQQYPAYDDMSDAELSDALHKRFYGDIPQEQFIEITQGALPPSPDMGGTQTLPPADPRPEEVQQAEREAILQAQKRPIPSLGEDPRAPQIAAGDERRALEAMAAAEPAAAFPNVSAATYIRAPLRPDMQMSSEATEAAASGIVKAAGNVAALGLTAIGAPGSPAHDLGVRTQEKVDAMPELEGLPHFVEFTTQFLVPFGILKPGVANLVGKGKKLLPAMLTPKATQALASGATQALTSGATAATAFSGQQHRLADYLVTFPQMKNSFTEYLASDPEDTQAEGRLKNAIEFATVDVILQGALFLALKGIKGAAAKSAPDGDIDMALALENVKPADAKSVRQELARPQQLELGHKPQLELGYKPPPSATRSERFHVFDVTPEDATLMALESGDRLGPIHIFKIADDAGAPVAQVKSRQLPVGKPGSHYEIEVQPTDLSGKPLGFEARPGDLSRIELLEIGEKVAVELNAEVLVGQRIGTVSDLPGSRLKAMSLEKMRRVLDKNPLQRQELARPQLQGSHAGVPDLPEAAKKVLHKSANVVGKSIDRLVGGAGMLDGENLWRPISSRIAELDPKSLRKLYQYELEKGTILTEEFAKVEPFLKSLRKLPSAERERIREAWLRSDINGINQVFHRNAAKVPGGAREFGEMRDALEDMYDLARENGEEVFYRREYLPRIVRDYEGMRAHLGTEDPLQRAIDTATAKKGTPLTTLQEREVIGEYMNKLYKGDGTPGYMKNRVIDKVPQDLVKYYGSVEDMLTNYVQNLTNRVAKARYVGTSPMLGPRSGWKDVLDEQVHLRKIDPKRGISVEDSAKVEKLIKARLGADATKVSTGGKIWRDIVHMTSIANPISTLTQLSEMLINAHRHGYFNTARAVGKQIKGSPISLSKLGVTDIAAEYADMIGAAEVGNWAKVQKGTNKTLEFALGASGFKKFDAILKNNNLNGAFIKARKLVGNKGTKSYQEFAQEQAKYFGKETKELMDAIRANDHDNPLVKEYLFHQLSGTQPISLSEYPVQYLKAGSAGRSFYYLKSFSMKMLETTRRDVLRKLASSDRKVVADGMKQFLTLAALTGGVASNNKLKSLLLDRDESWGEAFADGLMVNFGLSRYATQKFRSKNPQRRRYAVADILAPPKVTEALDVVLTTLTEGEVPTDTLQKQIPWGGKIFSEWWGAAHDRKVKERRAERNKKLKRLRGK